MMRTLAFSMVLALLALSGVGVYAQANSQQQRIDPFFRPVTASFKNTPLPDAVDTLLKDSGLSYTFTRLRSDPSGYNVTAVFKNVPMESALLQTLKATGMQYTKLGEYITIYDPQWQASQSSGYSGFSGGYGSYGGMNQQQLPMATGGKQAMEKVTTQYISPATIIPLAQADPGLQIANSGTNWLVINGNDASRKQFREMVRSLDTPSALLRPVIIKLKVEVTVTGKDGKKEASLAETSSTGAEGTRVPLTISGKLGAKSLMLNSEGQVVERPMPEARSLEINVVLTPTILSDGLRISLTGNGRISGQLPMEVNKDFEVAVSLPASGGTGTIAEGSMELTGGAVSFSVSATAKIGEGRVQFPSNQVQMNSALQQAIQQDAQNRLNNAPDRGTAPPPPNAPPDPARGGAY